MKVKGERFERELLNKLWEIGFAAVRSPSSGSMSYPSPDLIAGNGRSYLAIEVKMRSKLPLYISKNEIEDLKIFSKIFGAKPLIALKVKGFEWRFFNLESLKETEKGYKIDEENFYRGFDLYELRGLKQVRFD